MRNFSRRLRHMRKEAGFATAQAAALAHCWPVSTYRAHENGLNWPSLGMFLDYAKAFGCGPEWLAFGSPGDVTKVNPKKRDNFLPPFAPYCVVSGTYDPDEGFKMLRKIHWHTHPLPFYIEQGKYLALRVLKREDCTLFDGKGGLLLVEKSQKSCKNLRGQQALIRQPDGKIRIQIITAASDPALKARRVLAFVPE